MGIGSTNVDPNELRTSSYMRHRGVRTIDTITFDTAKKRCASRLNSAGFRVLAHLETSVELLGVFRFLIDPQHPIGSSGDETSAERDKVADSISVGRAGL